MKLFSAPQTRVIILKDGLLSDEQITTALRTSEQTMWWRALVQLIEHYRETGAAVAATSASANNPLAMAANNGAYATLTELLSDLESRRSSK